MAQDILVVLGTKKGAFILRSDAGRRHWSMRGPFCETWPMNHVVADPVTGTIYAGGGNEWFGPAVWKSTDFGDSWTHSSEGLAYPEGEEPVKSVWSLAPSAWSAVCWGAAGRPVRAATMTDRAGATCLDCATIPRGPIGNPAPAG